MNITDEIAERVANMLFEYLLRAAGFVSEVAPVGAKAISNANDAFMEALMKRFNAQHYLKMDGQIEASELKKAAEHLKEHTRTIKIGDSDVKDFESMLKAEKVLYAKIESKNDDFTMFMYMDKDEKKVLNVTNALRARRGIVTEINPKLFVQALKPESVVTILGLDDVELALFRHYARETETIFTTTKLPDGNALIIPSSDKKKARRALFYAGWTLTGRNGDRIRQQVQYHLKGRNALNISAEEGTRELCIVSRKDPGHYIEISSEDYRIYKNYKLISTVSRSADEFVNRCISACEGLSEPVVLEKEQMEFMTPERIQTMHPMDMFPNDFDELAELEIQNRLHSMIAQKMGLDDEGNTPLNVTDTSISYSTFSEYEFIHDTEELAGREQELEHYKRTNTLMQDRFAFNEIERDDHNLDYIISQAESKRLAAMNAHLQTHRGEQAQTKDQPSPTL